MVTVTGKKHIPTTPPPPLPPPTFPHSGTAVAVLGCLTEIQALTFLHSHSLLEGERERGRGRVEGLGKSSKCKCKIVKQDLPTYIYTRAECAQKSTRDGTCTVNSHILPSWTTCSQTHNSSSEARQGRKGSVKCLFLVHTALTVAGSKQDRGDEPG